MMTDQDVEDENDDDQDDIELLELFFNYENNPGQAEIAIDNAEADGESQKNARLVTFSPLMASLGLVISF